MKNALISLLKFLFFFSIGFLILALLYRSQNAAYLAQCAMDGVPAESCNFLKKLWDDFQNAHFFWIGIMLFSYLLSNVSRSLRWKMLLAPMGYQARFWNLFHTVMLGYFANLGLPRMGEVARAGALARYEKIPVEKVMGTVVADRAVDLLCLLTVLAIAFFLEFQTLWGWLSQNAQLDDKVHLITHPYFLLALALMLIGSATLFLLRKKLKSSRLAQKMKGLISGFVEGIATVRKLEKPWIFVFHSAFIWFMYYLMVYFCFFAFQPTSHLGLIAALMVFIFGAFGIVIPSPGGMGSYHALVMAALGLYQIPGLEAFSFANIIFFSVQIFGNVLFGILALILLPLINRSVLP